MKDLKVGDFVKHKDNKRIIFQVVQILESASGKGSRMINCIRVTDIRSYLDTDVRRYELSDQDSEKIINHDL